MDRESADGNYQPIPREPSGGLFSKELELELRWENSQLEFYYPGTSNRLRTEREQKQLEAEARASEAEARQAVEAENSRLRAELAAIRNQNLG